MAGDFDKNKVLGRIRKMLALANDAAASEGERDNALRMVQSTLAKYGLEMAEAEAAGKQAPEERGTHVATTHGGPWVRQIAAAIADLLFCHYLYVRGARCRHLFIGRLSNAVTAQEMFMFVFKSIEREAKARTPNDWRHTTQWATSFAKGAAHRIEFRCVLLRAESERASAQQARGAPGTALVLASHYANEKAANVALIKEVFDKPIKVSKNMQQPAKVHTAWHEGDAYGNMVSLQKQIKGS